jgi:hypothetical protein
MAGHRLSLAAPIALVALAAPGCDTSAAQPAAPPALAAPTAIQPALAAALPADWVPLPTVAAAALAAAREVPGVSAGAAAWGDPAAGCYLLATELRGAHRDRLRAVLDRMGWHLDAQAVMHAWQVPATDVDPAELTGRLTVGGLTGAVRGLVSFDGRALPRAGLAACFYNPREPRACEAACAQLLPQLQIPPVTP